MELGKLLTLDTKALVLGQMPVKDVELDCCHRIQIPFENFHRLEVAGDVNQQAAPGKARLILDLNSR